MFHKNNSQQKLISFKNPWENRKKWSTLDLKKWSTKSSLFFKEMLTILDILLCLQDSLKVQILC
jgi:hypothetical protein